MDIQCSSGIMDLRADLSPISSCKSSTRLASLRRYYRLRSKLIDRSSVNRSRLLKASRFWRVRKQTMQTIGTLKRLVPTVPKDEQVSRVQLLQHVIDYIFELQRQLNDPLTASEDREP